MAVSPRFLVYVLEQLGRLRAVRANRMFNGVGLYSDEIFFAVLVDDTLYFKTSDLNIADYRERGMPQFMPFRDRPETVLGYYQVPADVLEDAETLVEWARKSVTVALEKAKSKPRRKSRASKTADKPVKKTAKKPAVKSVNRKPAPRSSRR